MKTFSLFLVVILLFIAGSPVQADTEVAFCAEFGYDDLFIFHSDLDVSLKTFYNDDGSVDYIQRRNHGTWTLTRVSTDKTLTFNEHRLVVFNYEGGIRVSTDISGFINMTGGNLQKPFVFQAGNYVVPPGPEPVPVDQFEDRNGIFLWETLCDEIIAATN